MFGCSKTYYRAQDLSPDQRTILITGCSSGIGLQCAQSLHQLGYRVFACVRKPEDQERLQALGLDTSIMDLADSHSIQSGLAHILAKTNQQLFALFNNAGYGQPGAVEDISREMMQKQFETNVFGTQELTNLVLPLMRKQGYGRIIYTSSVLGFISLPFRGIYNASKHALEALADTLRLELTATPNISISLIEPGPIKSQFRQHAFENFTNEIDIAKSALRPVYDKLAKRLASPQADPPFTLGPEAVEKALLAILTTKHPKARYFVTFPTYLFAILKRCLTTKALDKVLLLAAGEEGRLLSSLKT